MKKLLPAAAHTRYLIAIWAAIASASVTSSASQEPGKKPQVPVVIQADPNFDACGGNGVVEGLDPSGDGFLAVRSGPGSKYGEIDRLYNGEQVYLCAEKGKWLGVVYSKRRQDCNVINSMGIDTALYRTMQVGVGASELGEIVRGLIGFRWMANHCR